MVATSCNDTFAPGTRMTESGLSRTATIAGVTTTVDVSTTPMLGLLQNT